MHALMTNKKLWMGLALVVVAVFAGSVIWNGILKANPDYVCSRVISERTEGEFGQCSGVSWTQWAPYSTTQDYRLGTGIKQRTITILDYQVSTRTTQAQCAGGSITQWSQVQGSKQTSIIEGQVCQTEEYRSADNSSSGGGNGGDGDGNDSPGEGGPSGGDDDGTLGGSGNGGGPGEWGGPNGGGGGDGTTPEGDPSGPLTILVPPELPTPEITCPVGYERSADGLTCTLVAEVQETELNLECSANQEEYGDCEGETYRLVDKSSCLYVRPIVVGGVERLERSAFGTEQIDGGPVTDLTLVDGSPRLEQELCLANVAAYDYNPKQFQTRVVMIGKIPNFAEGRVSKDITLQFLNPQIEEQ